ncbi:rap1 GTPase-activating protein 1 [Pelomyxa schiedti]|nr:rap1 GTPase-activating protein 1 [Pelomyxa schiedti]
MGDCSRNVPPNVVHFRPVDRVERGVQYVFFPCSVQQPPAKSTRMRLSKLLPDINSLRTVHEKIVHYHTQLESPENAPILAVMQFLEVSLLCKLVKGIMQDPLAAVTDQAQILELVSKISTGIDLSKYPNAPNASAIVSSAKKSSDRVKEEACSPSSTTTTPERYIPPPPFPPQQSSAQSQELAPTSASQREPLSALTLLSVNNFPRGDRQSVMINNLVPARQSLDILQTATTSLSLRTSPPPTSSVNTGTPPSDTVSDCVQDLNDLIVYVKHPKYQTEKNKTKELLDNFLPRRRLPTMRRMSFASVLPTASEKEQLIDVAAKDHFRLEFGSGPQGNNVFLLDDPLDFERYYTDYISRRDHVNIIARQSNGQPVIASVCLEGEPLMNNNQRAIIRHVGADKWSIIEPTRCKTSKECVEVLSTLGQKCKLISHYTSASNRELVDRLIELDKKLIRKTFNFGVIYVKPNQTDQNSILANDDISPKFEEFLNLIGSRVVLKGFSGYSGELDINNGTHGTISYHTAWRGLEIMYHVAPLMPNTGDKLERKRKIGNDVVCIVYKEGPTPFPPQCITTDFTHVYLVVEEAPSNKYRVAIASRKEMCPFGPQLAAPPLFNKDITFKEFLITKLLNGHQAALRTPIFASLLRARAQLLSQILESLR